MRHQIVFLLGAILGLTSFSPLTNMLSAQTPASQSPDLQRMKYNHPGLVVDLGVGLWGWPLPMDYDQDGDLDLIVSCSDVPYRGIYFFENPGGDSKFPIFKPGVRIASGQNNITLSHVEGQPRVLTPNRELTKVLQGDFSTSKLLNIPKEFFADRGKIRANQWSYVDFDGDGVQDLIVGQGLWDDYGWDDAFNEKGKWTRGPLHGVVSWLRNVGTSEKPEYQKPEAVTAEGQPVDVYGMPSPNFADFDGDDDLDLLCGDFLDGFTYFQNIGTRTAPKYAAGQKLKNETGEINMHLCMIVVTAVDWDQDGDVDLIVGQEDGRIAFLENSGDVVEGMPQFANPRFFQQEADEVKFGALVTPVSFDWDGDGDEDLVCGNTAGEIGWIENLDNGNPPRWAAPVLIQAEGADIRIMAGENGSIQGPAETKWGYTTISVADWNHDGLPDLIANSIWGKIVWYQNIGTRTAPEFQAAQSITVDWPSAPPKPAWNWWNPENQELVTQWRTTPCVYDWNDDGLNDLVMLDHEGYLAWFERQKQGDQLVLKPGQRIFAQESDAVSRHDNSEQVSPKLLQLNAKTAGGSGRRKLCLIDWDGDQKVDLLINSSNVNLLRQTRQADGFFFFVEEGPLFKHRLAGHTTSPTTVDWNQDGKRELLIGAEDGYFYYSPLSP